MRRLALLLSAAVLAACTTVPTDPRQRELPLDVAGETLPAHWTLPAADPAALVLLQHGFSRRCVHLRGTAAALRDQGLAVLCVDASMAAGNPPLAAALAATLAGLQRLPDGRALPPAIVVGGHSAGAAFAVQVGAGLLRLAPERLAGALLLDPVATRGFDAALQAVSDQGRRPVLALLAPPHACNAQQNAAPALRGLLPAAGFVGLVAGAGATHIDAEGADSDAVARWACGTPLPAQTARLRAQAAAWALDIATGRRPAPPVASSDAVPID
ncbi:alpha/beta hydrolase [Rubrivivax sp. RP6-9]|uniref:alpha/beta hydrolase n=1 Tax=Rubrivivax sp. RP6-9 TaxID=3415750 RepID=UPI003CC6501F